MIIELIQQMYIVVDYLILNEGKHDLDFMNSNIMIKLNLRPN